MEDRGAFHACFPVSRLPLPFSANGGVSSVSAQNANLVGPPTMTLSADAIGAALLAFVTMIAITATSRYVIAAAVDILQRNACRLSCPRRPEYGC